MIIPKIIESYIVLNPHPFNLFDNSIISMPPKQSRKTKPKSESPSQTPQESQSNPENKDKFTCKCKKSYLSKSALYTHIKNKHPELDTKTTKKKTLIRNDPKQNSQELNSRIKIHKMYANVGLSQFTSNAMVTYQNIALYIKEFDNRSKTRTYFENYDDQNMEEVLSDQQDANFDQNKQEQIKESKINDRIESWTRKYQLTQIGNMDEAKQFKWIKINNTNICMSQQLTKYFNIQFASKIQFSLLLIVSQNKGISQVQKGKYNQVLDELWRELSPLNQILKNYVTRWMELMQNTNY